MELLSELRHRRGTWERRPQADQSNSPWNAYTGLDFRQQRFVIRRTTVERDPQHSNRDVDSRIATQAASGADTMIADLALVDPLQLGEIT